MSGVQTHSLRLPPYRGCVPFEVVPSGFILAPDVANLNANLRSDCNRPHCASSWLAQVTRGSSTGNGTHLLEYAGPMACAELARTIEADHPDAHEVACCHSSNVPLAVPSYRLRARCIALARPATGPRESRTNYEPTLERSGGRLV